MVLACGLLVVDPASPEVIECVLPALARIPPTITNRRPNLSMMLIANLAAHQQLARCLGTHPRFRSGSRNTLGPAT
jgi:hypothetical protein